MALDQYGQTYLIRRHPRKELLEQLVASHAQLLYRDMLGGGAQHVGYVIRGLWIEVFRLADAWPGASPMVRSGAGSA